MIGKPDEPQQNPSSRSAALLWTVAVVGVLGGLGLYLARGNGAPAGSEPAAAPAAAPVAAAPDPTPTPPPPANYFIAPACRLFDGPVAPGDSVIDLDAACGVPANARTLAVAVSVIAPTSAGTLALRAADGAAEAAGTGAVLEFQPGLPSNGTAYAPLSAAGVARVGVRNTSATPVRLILDLSGYFE